MLWHRIRPPSLSGTRKPPVRGRTPLLQHPSRELVPRQALPGASSFAAGALPPGVEEEPLTRHGLHLFPAVEGREEAILCPEFEEIRVVRVARIPTLSRVVHSQC